MKKLLRKQRLSEKAVSKELLSDDDLFPLVSSRELSDNQKQILDFYMESDRRKGKTMEEMLSLVHTFAEEQYILQNWGKAHA